MIIRVNTVLINVKLLKLWTKCYVQSGHQSKHAKEEHLNQYEIVSNLFILSKIILNLTDVNKTT